MTFQINNLKLTLFILILSIGLAYSESKKTEEFFNSEYIVDTLILKEGPIHIGLVVAETPQMVIINTEDKSLKFARNEVDKIVYYEPAKIEAKK